MSFLEKFFGPPDITKLAGRRDIQGLRKAMKYQKDAGIQKAAVEALDRIVSQSSYPICRKCYKDLEKGKDYDALSYMGASYRGVVCEKCGKIECIDCKGTPYNSPCSSCGGSVWIAAEKYLQKYRR